MKTISVIFFMIIIAVIIMCISGPAEATPATQDSECILIYPITVGTRWIQLVEPTDEHWYDGFGGGLVDLWWWLRK